MSLRAFLMGLLTAGIILAQSPRGAITGTIIDAQEARVPGVEVVARQVDTNLEFQGVSSDDGTYVIPNLPVGRYELTATVQGFKTFRRADIVLEVAQRLRLDITLELGALAETVTVTGVRPVNRSDDGFAEITNQGFSQITFNGGSVYGNQFFVDGGMNTVPVHNEISVVPMTDAVEEFKVETNAMKAEFGQTSGGVVNVVTKAGTNELHGSLYEFFRNDSLDARNAFAVQRDPLTGRIKPVLRYNQSLAATPVDQGVTNMRGDHRWARASGSCRAPAGWSSSWRAAGS